VLSQDSQQRAVQKIWKVFPRKLMNLYHPAYHRVQSHSSQQQRLFALDFARLGWGWGALNARWRHDGTNTFVSVGKQHRWPVPPVRCTPVSFAMPPALRTFFFLLLFATQLDFDVPSALPLPHALLSTSVYSPTGNGSIAPPGYSMNDDVDMIDYGGSVNGGGSRYIESPPSVVGSVARSRRGSSYQVRVSSSHNSHAPPSLPPSLLCTTVLSSLKFQLGQHGASSRARHARFPHSTQIHTSSFLALCSFARNSVFQPLLPISHARASSRRPTPSRSGRRHG
jgi:hypothetical protein